MFTAEASYPDKVAFLRDKVTIYPVSCELLSHGRSDIEWLEAVLAGGAKMVQLRDKHSDDLTLYRKALIFRDIAENRAAQRSNLCATPLQSEIAAAISR